MSTVCKVKPVKVVFAENPVWVKIASSLTGKRFLEVHVEVTAALVQEGVRVRTSVREFSLPSSGNGEEVTFNVAPMLRALLSMRRVQPLRGGSARQAGGAVRFEFRHWDSYLDEQNQVVSSVKFTVREFWAVSGGYTDVQRALGQEDTGAALAVRRVFSNRPKGLLHPVGWPFVFSQYRFAESELLDPPSVPVAAVSAQGRSFPLGSVAGVANEVEQVRLGGDWTKLEPGNYVIDGVLEVTLVPPSPDAVYFEFVNRLGALESVVCFARVKEEFKLKGERNVRQAEVGFRPSARYVRRWTSQECVLSLSTGAVSRLQAQWFVQDFFCAEQCWMFDPQLDMMVPVVIESEEYTVYDFTKPQVFNLEFEVVRSWNGYHTGGAFSGKGF